MKNFLLLSFIGFYLFKIIDAAYFEIFGSNTTSNLKLSANFELAYLLNSFETKIELLSLTECLALHNTNIFTKAILYENLDGSKIMCNSYSSQPNLNSDATLSQSIKSKIYIKKNALGKNKTKFDFY